MTLFTVELTQDKARIRAFLERDRLWGAYALGDLEPALFPHCLWGVASDARGDVALVLLFQALTPPGLLTFGDPQGAIAILSEALQPAHVFFMIATEHLAALRELYEIGALDPMLRMVVDVTTFRPKTLTPQPPLLQVERGSEDSPSPLSGGRGWGIRDSIPRPITPADLDALNTLYAGGETPGAFAPFQIEQGVFYGVELDGRLVAAAGTHLVAPSQGVAAVGNVYTDRAHRGRGLAQLCTSAVVVHCFDLGIRDVVLNVDSRNAPAIAAYRRLGFREHRAFYEAHGERLRNTHYALRTT
ncbi:MAG: GNAT family N-acetyltransferase [Anaerolineae bacterium]|nr:GNAT family N-acetyltransferase [Anaerolineae bacterium]